MQWSECTHLPNDFGVQKRSYFLGDLPVHVLVRLFPGKCLGGNDCQWVNVACERVATETRIRLELGDLWCRIGKFAIDKQRCRLRWEEAAVRHVAQFGDGLICDRILVDEHIARMHSAVYYAQAVQIGQATCCIPDKVQRLALWIGHWKESLCENVKGSSFESHVPVIFGFRSK